MKKFGERPATMAKRCPLCGGRAMTETREHFYDRCAKVSSYIRCRECDLTIYGMPVSRDGSLECTYNEAQHRVLKLWNRRTAA